MHCLYSQLFWKKTTTAVLGSSGLHLLILDMKRKENLDVN